MKITGIKTMLLGCCAIGLTALSANAAVTLNVIANGAGSGLYLDAAGNTLPAGSLMRVGTLNLADFNLLSTTEKLDFNTVNPLFTEIATLAASGTGTFFQTGIVITGQADVGAQLYTWVFDAATAETSTAYGIFSSENPLWKAPADPGSATLSNVGFATEGQLLVGSGFVATGTGSGTNALLVPEPSAALLGALGALGLLRRRRI